MTSYSYKLFRCIVRFLLNLIASVQVSGFESIPSGGLIVAANHVGRLDAALAFYVLNRQDIIMVVAEKYEKYAIYRWLVRLINGMFVDRYNSDIHAIRETLRRLQKGQVFTITPEGTRSKSGNLLPGKPGAIYLAWKAGVNILPVAITGTEDVVVVQRLKHLKRLHIKVAAGKPFMLPSGVKGSQREAMMQQYTDEVMCRIAALLPEDRRGVYADHPLLKELLAG